MKYVFLLLCLVSFLQVQAQKLPSQALLARLTHQDDTVTMRKIRELDDKRWAEKIKLYKTTDPISSDFVDAQANIIYYAADSADFKKDGAEALEQLIHFFPDQQSKILSLSHLYYQVYDPVKAASIKAEYEKLYPLGAELKLTLADHYLRKRKYEALDQLIPDLLKLRPMNGVIYNLIAKRYFRQNMYTEGYIWAMVGTLISKQQYQIAINLTLINTMLQSDFADQIGNAPRISGAAKIDEVLQSRIATSKEFDCKCIVSSQDFNQMQLLMQQLRKNDSYSNSKGITRDMAMVALEEIEKNDNFRTMTTGLIAIFTEDASDRQKLISKHLELINKIQTKFDALPLMKTLEFKGKTWYPSRSKSDINGLIEALFPVETEEQLMKLPNQQFLMFNIDGDINKLVTVDKGTFTEIKYQDPKGWVYRQEYYLASGRSGQSLKTTYWSNGQKRRSHIQDKQGNIIGSDTTWFKNGQISSLTAYKNGKYEGPTVTFHKNGKPNIAKLTYKAGERDGEFASYHDNGQLKFKGTFKNGTPIGHHEEYYKDGTLSDKSFHSEKLTWHDHYRKGGSIEWHKRYGKDKKDTVIEYLSNGLISTVRVVNATGEIIQNYLEGKLELVQEKDGKGNLTKLVSYTADGKALPFVAGGFDGVVQTPHPSWGLPYQEYSINKSGLLNGLHLRKLPSGPIISADTFENGQNKGIKYTYHPSGAIKDVLNLSYNQNEPFYDYSLNPNGTIKVVQQRINDTVHARELTYNDNGKLQQASLYNMGSQVGWEIHYEQDGKTIDHIERPEDDDTYVRHQYLAGNYIGSTNDTAKGVQTVFYPNGKPMLKFEYRDFKPVNKSTRYYPDGQVAYENEYDQDGEFKSKKSYDALGFLVNSILSDKAKKTESELVYEAGKLWSKQLTNNRVDSTFSEYYLYDGSLFMKEESHVDAPYELLTLIDPLTKKPIVTLLSKDRMLYKYAGYNAKGELNPYQLINQADQVIDIKYANGKQAVLIETKNNTRHGKFNIYYSNGQMLRSRTLDFGIVTGKEEIYYPNGQLMETNNYENGHITGLSKFFYPSGKVMVEIGHETDTAPGYAKHYDETGKLLKHRVVKFGLAYEPNQDLVTTK